MPNPMSKQDLYSQLMRYYGAPYSQIGDANEVLKQMGVNIDTSTYDDPNMALLDSPLGEFMSESFGNEWRKESANRDYDSQQPYGFDFIRPMPDPLYEGSSMPGTDFKVFPDGDVIGPDGFVSVGPETQQKFDLQNPNLEPGVVNALVPIAKTAGSYALPMLFSMLMRGGR